MFYVILIFALSLAKQMEVDVESPQKEFYDFIYLEEETNHELL